MFIWKRENAHCTIVLSMDQVGFTISIGLKTNVKDIQFTNDFIFAITFLLIDYTHLLKYIIFITDIPTE